MTEAALELADAGLGVSLQDLGRRGWKRFGVPPGGALDSHAARWANLLMGNPLNAPVLEILFHGARLRVLAPMEIAITGAATLDETHRWRTWLLEPGHELVIPPAPAGVWSYLATTGGFVGPRWFGSVSIFPRGGLGEPMTAGALVRRPGGPSRHWPHAVGGRWVDPGEQRDYSRPPVFKVWPGPQWELFSSSIQTEFFTRPWRVSSRSDRTGYRLEGESVERLEVSLPSEPIIPGSIQIPPDGQPIVTLHDGPTVGGYPKLGLIDPGHLSWLVQCRPGQLVHFALATEESPSLLAAPHSPSGTA